MICVGHTELVAWLVLSTLTVHRLCLVPCCLQAGLGADGFAALDACGFLEALAQLTGLTSISIAECVQLAASSKHQLQRLSALTASSGLRELSISAYDNVVLPLPKHAVQHMFAGRQLSSLTVGGCASLLGVAMIADTRISSPGMSCGAWMRQT